MKIYIEPTDTIMKKLKLNEDGEAQAFFTDTCRKHMDKYVPKDIGNLRDILDVGIDYITYESPYAEYQYKGQRRDGSRKVTHYTTPGTGTYWDRRMKSAELDKVVREVQRFVNGKK